MGDLGREKLERVKKNSDYFRDSLIAMYVNVNALSSSHNVARWLTTVCGYVAYTFLQGLRGFRRRGLTSHSAYALQPDQDCCLLARVLQTRTGGRRRGLPGNPRRAVPGQILHFGWPHP